LLGLVPRHQPTKILSQQHFNFAIRQRIHSLGVGDLEPISVQPGGADMVVNLYNKANDTIFAYYATYDVVVAFKECKIKALAPSEFK
jgi:hypothetical protein